LPRSTTKEESYYILMQKLSSIVSKKDLQIHWQKIEPDASLIHAYALGVHDHVSILLDDKGTMRSAYWGTNSDLQKQNIERPFVIYEKAHIKPTFRMAFRSRRAIALIDSFYVWDRHRRRPFRVYVSDMPILLVPALYFFMPDESVCCTLLVRDSSSELKELTTVQPIIFDSQTTNSWLDLKTDISSCINLLKHSELPAFERHSVSNKILIEGFNDKILHNVSQTTPSLFEVCE
jgi:putative SOS response-associated peptidase YedK